MLHSEHAKAVGFVGVLLAGALGVSLAMCDSRKAAPVEPPAAWYPAPEPPAHAAIKAAALAPVVGKRQNISIGTDAYGRTLWVTEYTTGCPYAGQNDPCAVYAIGSPKDPATSRIIHDGTARCMVGAKSFATACDAQAINTASSYQPEGWDAGP